MTKLFNALLLAGFIAILLVASRWIGLQAYTWMPGQVTAEAKQVDDLFSFLVSIGAFIFLGLVGMIGYAIATSRAPRDDWSHGHPARHHTRLEILWTVTPLLLVFWLAGQSFKIYQQLNIQGLTPIAHLHMPMAVEPAAAETPNGDEKPTENDQAKAATQEIDVMAKQWAWLFRYPGNVTSTELHLPVNQSVQLKLQSQDVLHGFYVPEFRVKQDIIPNRLITFTVTPIREGKYRLQDSQFSGTYFSLMAADVYVESAQAYRQWLQQAATQTPTTANNLAFSEHAQQLQKQRGRGWATVVPASPPMVNYSSRKDGHS